MVRGENVAADAAVLRARYGAREVDPVAARTIRCVRHIQCIIDVYQYPRPRAERRSDLRPVLKRETDRCPYPGLTVALRIPVSDRTRLKAAASPFDTTVWF